MSDVHSSIVVINFIDGDKEKYVINGEVKAEEKGTTIVFSNKDKSWIYRLDYIRVISYRITQRKRRRL
jgi:hypothetical protein